MISGSLRTWRKMRNFTQVQCKPLLSKNILPLPNSSKGRAAIVIGHLGETLPFMMQRLDVMPMAMTKLDRPISSYLRENVHYTVSGFNFMATFLDLLLQVGVERIMFSADYPYASMKQARAFLEQIPVSAADKERIARTNAERLFGL